MPIDFMVMAMKIWHLETSDLYDFVSYLEDDLYEDLLWAKNLKENLKLKNYSLICYMILFQNRTYWDDALQIKKFDPRIKERWLVQRLTQSWDRGSKFADYKAFCDHSVMKVLEMCGERIQIFLFHIDKVLRIKDAREKIIEYPEGDFSQNFGDFSSIQIAS